MKINVEVNLDWVSEEESIDEAIQRKVISAVSSEVMKLVDKQRFQAIASVVNDKIDDSVNEMLSGFLEKGFQPTDQWGDKKGEPIKVLDLLKERLENFFLENVDSHGKKTNYSGSPRYKQILDRESKSIIEKFQTDLSKDVISGIKKDINDEARKRITDSILSDYDLKKLIK